MFNLANTNNRNFMILSQKFANLVLSPEVTKFFRYLCLSQNIWTLIMKDLTTGF